MTIIDDVFMLPYNTVLDFETVSNIIRQGYTRIPVYDGNRDTIVALLNIKGSLALRIFLRYKTSDPTLSSIASQSM